MPKKSKLPANLYVRIMNDGDNTEYFNADTAMWSLVDMGETVQLGIYKLVGTQEASGVVETKRSKP